MSGPLHVTHLMVFNQSDANTNAAEDDKDDPTSNVNLRVTRLPRGPTLGFKVLRYALVRDILNATKRPRSPGKEFNTEPIVSPRKVAVRVLLHIHSCNADRASRFNQTNNAIA